jgi:hypothetical protein
VKAFGTLGADRLATAANDEPRTVLFYATDDDVAETTAKRLGPDGDLQGRTLDLEAARATVATEGVQA